MSPTSSKSFAILDIGSRSSLLLVGHVPSGELVIEAESRAVTGLGRNLKETRLLSSEGADATAAFAAESLETAKSLNLESNQVFAVATQAMRVAEDAPAFAERLRALGLNLQILSGEDEARLTLKALKARLPNDSAWITFDLGGASLEISSDRHDSVSLPIGILAAGNELEAAFNQSKAERDRNQSIFSDACSALSEKAKAAIRPFANDLSASPFLLGTGGGLCALASRALHQKEYKAAEIDQHSFTQAELILAGIKGMSSVEPNSSDFETLAAVHIIVGLMEAAGAETLSVSTWGLRHGVLLDLCERLS